MHFEKALLCVVLKGIPLKKFLLLGLLISSLSEASQVIIIRHGQSDHNVEHFRSSNESHPNYRVSHLTAQGKREVLRSARDLKARYPGITRVYASPLPRTKETARIVMKELGIPDGKLYIDIRLTEKQAGDLEGRHISYRLPHARGIETRKKIEERVRSFRKILNPNETVLIVTHAAPATALNEALDGKRSSFKTASFVVTSLKTAKKKKSIRSRSTTVAVVKHLKNKRSKRK